MAEDRRLPKLCLQHDSFLNSNSVRLYRDDTKRPFMVIAFEEDVDYKDVGEFVERWNAQHDIVATIDSAAIKAKLVYKDEPSIEDFRDKWERIGIGSGVSQEPPSRSTRAPCTTGTLLQRAMMAYGAPLALSEGVTGTNVIDMHSKAILVSATRDEADLHTRLVEFIKRYK